MAAAGCVFAATLVMVLKFFARASGSESPPPKSAIEMRKILIYVFAIIGLISTLKFCYDLFNYQSDAAEFLNKCHEVKIGMTLQEAKKLMGDYSYYERKNRSEIWTCFDGDSVKVYYLTYPASFSASTGTEIYFNPSNQVVTKVICGE